MSIELLKRGHTGRIVSMTCVRYKGDLGYLDQQEHKHHPSYVGKQYLQDIIRPERFEEAFGWSPDPENTHVFLCGNPSMIGLPEKNELGELVFPDSKGMVELLTEQGYKLSTPKNPGNIHFEKYW